MLTHPEMRTALQDGAARPMSWLVPDFVYYRDCWWLLAEPGWLRIEDRGLLALLSQQQLQTDGYAGSAGEVLPPW